MAERWRTGRSIGKTIYVDDKVVGYIEDVALAAEIVETMNRVGRLLDEVRQETATERSPAQCRCGFIDVGSTYHEYVLDRADPDCPFHGEQPADAERRSEATPQNDLCRGCGRTSHGFACPAQLEAARREQDQLSRVDPYDTTEGGVTE